MTKKEMNLVGTYKVMEEINKLFNCETLEELRNRKRIVRGRMYMLDELQLINAQQYNALNKLLGEAYAKNLDRFREQYNK